MPIIYKSPRELMLMRDAGVVANDILAKMRRAAVAGVTTGELEDLARSEMAAVGAISLSKNYPTYKANEGFPFHTCISVNEFIVHGFPNDRRLKDGDIVTLDVALKYNGYCSDTATTIAIGRVSPQVQKLLDITRESLALAINNMKPGRWWSDIARLVQKHVEKNGFNCVREFVGHGIGRELHEDPKVPNFVTSEQLRADFMLRRGMTLAVEPMVVMGRRDVVMMSDGWQIVTQDKLPAAHFEHTVAVTDTGVEILTDGRAAVPVVAATAS